MYLMSHRKIRFSGSKLYSMAQMLLDDQQSQVYEHFAFYFLINSTVISGHLRVDKKFNLLNKFRADLHISGKDYRFTVQNPQHMHFLSNFISMFNICQLLINNKSIMAEMFNQLLHRDNRDKSHGIVLLNPFIVRKVARQILVRSSLGLLFSDDSEQSQSSKKAFRRSVELNFYRVDALLLDVGDTEEVSDTKKGGITTLPFSIGFQKYERVVKNPNKRVSRSFISMTFDNRNNSMYIDFDPGGKNVSYNNVAQILLNRGYGETVKHIFKRMCEIILDILKSASVSIISVNSTLFSNYFIHNVNICHFDILMRAQIGINSNIDVRMLCLSIQNHIMTDSVLSESSFVINKVNTCILADYGISSADKHISLEVHIPILVKF